MAKKTKAPVSKKPAAKTTPTRVPGPFEEMEQMFEHFFPPGWMRPFVWKRPLWSELAMPFDGRLPKVDVIEHDDTIVVHAELPGVDKKDLDITVTDDNVVIKGHSHNEKEEEKGDYHCKEISTGSFSRTLSLPANVNGAKAKSSFKDGVLELTLPKLEKSKRHTIKVE